MSCLRKYREIQDMPVEVVSEHRLGVPKGRSWESVWLWHPPLTEANWEAWREQAGRGGLVVLAFGSKDVRDVQLSLCKSLPDRRGLARIYAVLRDRSANGSLEERTALEYLGELGLERGLWFAAESICRAWFVECGAGRIAFLPAPAKS